MSPGRNLEHFEITGHIDSCDVQAYRSQFLGKPCVLKVRNSMLILICCMYIHVVEIMCYHAADEF